jgi:hypothetical protein
MYSRVVQMLYIPEMKLCRDSGFNIPDRNPGTRKPWREVTRLVAARLAMAAAQM